MTKPGFISFRAAVAALGAVLLAWQFQARLSLRAENLALRRQIGERTPWAAENERLAGLVVEARRDAGSSNQAFAELLSLRAEVAAQESEIHRLRSDPARGPESPTSQTSPASPRFVLVPKESWGRAGDATPEAALESMLWAAREGDVNSLRDSLTLEEQQRRLAGEWKGKSDDEIAADNVQRLSQATGFEILNTQMLAPDQAHFTVYIDGFEQADQPLWMDMRKIGDQWKSDGSYYQTSR